MKKKNVWIYLQKRFYAILRIFINKKMVFTEEDQPNYWSEKTCHIIEDEFIQGDKNYCKVRDHCHSMGKY